LDDLPKGLGIADRQVCQDLAVQADVGLVERVDQRRVAHAEVTGRGVDADDPQLAEVTLLALAVPGGEAPRVADRLDQYLPQLRPAAAVAAGLLADAIAAPA